MIREAFENLIRVLHPLFVIFGFVEFNHIFEQVGFFFGEGAALTGLGIVGRHCIIFVGLFRDDILTGSIDDCVEQHKVMVDVVVVCCLL